MCGTFGKLFNKSRVVDIGLPTDMRQIIHVSKNSETGQLEGLPTDWSLLLDIKGTPTEQNKNPDAAIHAVKHPIKRRKAPDVPLKPSLTNETITEENNEIEKPLDHKSTIGQSSEEEVNNINKLSQKQTTTPAEKNENPDTAMIASTHPKCFRNDEPCKILSNNEASAEENEDMEQNLDHKNTH